MSLRYNAEDDDEDEEDDVDDDGVTNIV